MKSFLLFIALLCAIALSGSPASSSANTSSAARVERAQMTFAQPVELIGYTLQGQYLFVHDDAAMARGEACTYVYKGLVEKPKNLVVAFHCTPAERNKVDYFTVRTLPNTAGVIELREFQYAGSTEAHVVPTNLHTVHVASPPMK